MITIIKGKDFPIRDYDYPMKKIKEKETFSWLLIHCIETIMNSMFFKDVFMLDTEDSSFRGSDIHTIQRTIVKSKKKSTLVIRAIPTPAGSIPELTDDMKTSLILKSLF